MQLAHLQSTAVLAVAMVPPISLMSRAHPLIAFLTLCLLTSEENQAPFTFTKTGAETIFAFRVSKATMVVSECTTRPGNDFRHKFANRAEQSAKW